MFGSPTPDLTVKICNMLKAAGSKAARDDEYHCKFFNFIVSGLLLLYNMNSDPPSGGTAPGAVLTMLRTHLEAHQEFVRVARLKLDCN